MEDKRVAHIRAAVKEWARKAYHTDEIVVGMATEDDIDDEEGTRFLIDFAVRKVGHWSVAEAWIAGDKILSVNDLGEGLPLDEATWPWAAEEIA
jgi:hypothetical protein